MTHTLQELLDMGGTYNRELVPRLPEEPLLTSEISIEEKLLDVQ